MNKPNDQSVPSSPNRVTGQSQKSGFNIAQPYFKAHTIAKPDALQSPGEADDQAPNTPAQEASQA